MSVNASLARAKEAAAKLPHVPGDVSELLRADAVTFCSKAPDPPVYRRRDDPSRVAAQELIGEGEAILARAYHSNDAPWIAALEAWLTTLHHIADGKVELAEVTWVYSWNVTAASGTAGIPAPAPAADRLPTNSAR
jgi:hypothetical protein